INRGSGGLETRDADRNAYENDECGDRPDDLAAALLLLNFRTGDIHCVILGASGEPFSGAVNSRQLRGLARPERARGGEAVSPLGLKCPLSDSVCKGRIRDLEGQ